MVAGKTPKEKVAQVQAVAANSFAMPKIKRTFNAEDKEEFIAQAFQEIQDYFIEGLQFLESQNTALDTNLEVTGDQNFACRAAVQGVQKAFCRVYKGSIFGMGAPQILLSFQEGGAAQTVNEYMSIENDGYNLYLAPSSPFDVDGKQIKQATVQEAGLYLWGVFTTQLEA